MNNIKNEQRYPLSSRASSEVSDQPATKQLGDDFVWVIFSYSNTPSWYGITNSGSELQQTCSFYRSDVRSVSQPTVM